MENANVRLSPEELELVQDANVILTKNAVMEKAKLLLAGVSGQAQQQLAHAGPLLFGSPQTPPRISRGENYLGLPWVAMDYPRVFEQQGVSAIRHIFLWGKHFCCAWHCSGVYKEKAVQAVLAGHAYFSEKNWLLYTGSDEWAHEWNQHHVHTGSLTPTEFAAILNRQHFFKLCKYLPLSRWNETTDFYTNCLEELINIPV